MATYEQLIAAAQKADAAGETADARQLLEMALALRRAAEPALTAAQSSGGPAGNPSAGIIEVELPDGTIVEFPEGTSEDVMRSALMSLQPTGAQKKADGTIDASRTGGLPMTPEQKRAVAIASAKLRLKQKQQSALQKNADGTYGQAPDGMIPNPMTGQMTERSLLGAQSEPSRAGAMAGGAMQGLGFGFGDEAMGLAGLIEGGPEMGALRREQARGTLEAQQEAFPVSYGGAEIAGAVGSSLAGASAAGLQVAPTLAGRAKQGAALGSLEGLVYGFGTGEGLGDRAADAGAMGALGGLMGGVAPAAIHWTRTGADRLIGGPVASMRSAPSMTRASQAVQTALDRSGKSVDDVAASLQTARVAGQPEFMTVDALGNSGQRMLSGIARQPGDARQRIVEFLANRQAGQGDRVGRFVAEGLDATDTAAKREAGLVAARRSAADAGYQGARQGAGPVDVRPVLAAIDDRIGGMQGSGVAGDGIDAKLASYRSRLAAGPSNLGPGETARELSDFDRVLGLKQQIGDDIGAAVRAGRNNEARELGKVQATLDAALEASSGGYRLANDDFARASRVIDQIPEGRAATSSRVRAEDTVNAYRGLTSEQQAAFRSGYSDPVIAQVEASAPGVNVARRLMSPKMQTELAAMEQGSPMLQDRLAREMEMFRTNQAATGGSMTADNLADAADVQALDVGPIINALSGRFGAAAQQVIGKAGNTMMGRNTATREEIARMLLSPDIQAALQPAMRKQLQVGKQSRVVEALMRSMERSAVGE